MLLFLLLLTFTINAESVFNCRDYNESCSDCTAKSVYGPVSVPPTLNQIQQRIAVNARYRDMDAEASSVFDRLIKAIDVGDNFEGGSLASNCWWCTIKVERNKNSFGLLDSHSSNCFNAAVHMDLVQQCYDRGGFIVQPQTIEKPGVCENPQFIQRQSTDTQIDETQTFSPRSWEGYRQRETDEQYERNNAVQAYSSVFDTEDFFLSAKNTVDNVAEFNHFEGDFERKIAEIARRNAENERRIAENERRIAEIARRNAEIARRNAEEVKARFFKFALLVLSIAIFRGIFAYLR